MTFTSPYFHSTHQSKSLLPSHYHITTMIYPCGHIPTPRNYVNLIQQLLCSTIGNNREKAIITTSYFDLHLLHTMTPPHRETRQKHNHTTSTRHHNNLSPMNTLMLSCSLFPFFAFIYFIMFYKKIGFGFETFMFCLLLLLLMREEVRHERER